MTGITFSTEPAYGKRVNILVLSPAGVDADLDFIGSHLYGKGKWERTPPPVLRTIPAELVQVQGFRLTEDQVAWNDFLDEVFATMDFVFFFNPFKSHYAEISRGSLDFQKPVFYSYSFASLHSERFVPLAKSAPSIPQKALLSAAELRTSRPTGVVTPPAPRRRRSAGRPAAAGDNPLVGPGLVCMDADVLAGVIDSMVQAADLALRQLRELQESLISK